MLRVRSTCFAIGSRASWGRSRRRRGGLDAPDRHRRGIGENAAPVRAATSDPRARWVSGLSTEGANAAMDRALPPHGEPHTPAYVIATDEESDDRAPYARRIARVA